MGSMNPNGEQDVESQLGRHFIPECFPGRLPLLEECLHPLPGIFTSRVQRHHPTCPSDCLFEPVACAPAREACLGMERPFAQGLRLRCKVVTELLGKR
jgi:hypothetical protein